MSGVTAELAQFAAGASCDALPEAVRTRAASLIADLAGIAIRARRPAANTGGAIEWLLPHVLAAPW